MMRIDGNQGNREAAVVRQMEKVGAERSATAGRQEKTAGDRVELSADAKLAQAALQAVQNTPDIRQDVVERARQKLLNGELGSDTSRLADKMIDHLLGI